MNTEQNNTQQINDPKKTYTLSEKNIDDFDVSKLTVRYEKSTTTTGLHSTTTHSLELKYENLNFVIHFPILYSKYGIQPEKPFTPDISKLERTVGVDTLPPPGKGYTTALEFPSKHQKWVHVLEDIDAHIMNIVKTTAIPQIPTMKLGAKNNENPSLFGWHFTHPNKKNADGDYVLDPTQDKRMMVKLKMKHATKRLVPELYMRENNNNIIINGEFNGKYYDILTLGKLPKYSRYINNGSIEILPTISFSLLGILEKGSGSKKAINYKLVPELASAQLFPCATITHIPVFLIDHDETNGSPVIHCPDETEEVSDETKTEEVEEC